MQIEFSVFAPNLDELLRSQINQQARCHNSQNHLHIQLLLHTIACLLAMIVISSAANCDLDDSEHDRCCSSGRGTRTLLYRFHLKPNFKQILISNEQTQPFLKRDEIGT